MQLRRNTSGEWAASDVVRPTGSVCLGHPTGPLRILVVLPDLSGGGAERLHVTLAKEWLASGAEVSFGLMERRGELLGLLPPGVDVLDLQARRIRDVALRLAPVLRRRRPDVVLAAMWPLTTAAVLAWHLAGRPGRLFVSDHCLLSSEWRERPGIPLRIARLLVRTSYSLASGVIAVSNAVKQDLRRISGLSDSAIDVIYNAAATGIQRDRASAAQRDALWGPGAGVRILSVGRLKNEKDHATLIRAFALLAPSLRARLAIIGDGPLRDSLRRLVDELGVRGSVLMPGFAIDPFPWFQSADLFVLSSRWEGFGNVLVEAMECGVPVVSTDCEGGPREILGGGRFGTLAPVGDPAALAQRITESLAAPIDPELLRARALTFAAPRIADQYLARFVQEI